MYVSNLSRGETLLCSKTINHYGEWRRAVDFTGTGSYFLLLIPLCARGNMLGGCNS